MGAKGSKASNFGFGRKPHSNKHHLETDIACPGCNVIYPKNSNF